MISIYLMTYLHNYMYRQELVTIHSAQLIVPQALFHISQQIFNQFQSGKRWFMRNFITQNMRSRLFSYNYVFILKRHILWYQGIKKKVALNIFAAYLVIIWIIIKILVYFHQKLHHMIITLPLTLGVNFKEIEYWIGKLSVSL